MTAKRIFHYVAGDGTHLSFDRDDEKNMIITVMGPADGSLHTCQVIKLSDKEATSMACDLFSDVFFKKGAPL